MSVQELPHGRFSVGYLQRRLYLVQAATDATAARQELLDSVDVPGDIDGLVIVEAEADEVTDLPNTFVGTVTWSNTGDFEPDSFEIFIDFGTESAHLTHSRGTVSRVPAAGESEVDFHGAINVQPDGTIDGCDIGVPIGNYGFEYIFHEGHITRAYIRTVGGLIGTVNNAEFHGHEAGELLFVRFEARRRRPIDQNWNGRLHFAISRNAVDLPVGGTIDVPDIVVPLKLGWDYLWVAYKQFTDVNSMRLVSVPIQANVERVYPFTDFGLLGVAE